MTIIKEKEIMHPLYTAKLENGVSITVFGDYGKGDDEKIYYHVGKMLTVCFKRSVGAVTFQKL